MIINDNSNTNNKKEKLSLVIMSLEVFKETFPQRVTFIIDFKFVE